MVRNSSESVEIQGIIRKVQRAIVAAQTPGSLPIQKVELSLKDLDQKMVGVGLEGAVLAFKAAIEGKHTEQTTHTLTLTMTPPKPKGETVSATSISEGDVIELLRTISAVQAGLHESSQNPLGFSLSSSIVEIDFVVKNDGTIHIVWEGEYDRETTNTLTLTFGM